MAQRKFVVLAVLAAAGVLESSGAMAQVYAPSAPQAYPSQQPYSGSPSYQGQPARYGDNRYSQQQPNFDALDEDDMPQTSSAMPSPGPVLSPNDPRYGRPMAPPPVYSDRGPPQQQGYGYQDSSSVRPSQGIGPGQGPVGAPVASDPSRPVTMAALPPEDQPETGAPKELPPHLKRQEVYYETKEPPGTVIVDTPNTHLYLVLGGNRAMRYGVRVGRDGFTWAGVQKVTRKAEWPDWHPPAEMIERQPYLPRFMAGGDGNPMGARAMYLGSTVYRIHGTNQPSTIGQFVSSGCVGMLNEDVMDLFDRVKVGTRVVVLPGGKPAAPAVASTQGGPTNLGPPGAQPNYTPVQGGAPVVGQAPAYRGDARTDATTVQPLPPPTTIR